MQIFPGYHQRQLGLTSYWALADNWYRKGCNIRPPLDRTSSSWPMGTSYPRGNTVIRCVADSHLLAKNIAVYENFTPHKGQTYLTQKLTFHISLTALLNSLATLETHLGSRQS